MTTNGNGYSNGDRPPQIMSAEQFAEYIEKRLTLHDDEIEFVDRDEMELQLRVRGAGVTANLTNFYAAYRENPAQIDAIARTFVRVLLGELPERTATDFADLADRVYPMLKPLELLVEVRERKLPMLVYREFLADLMIAYVIDEGRSVAFVNEDHLETWDVTAQNLHDQAINNLRARTYEQVDFVSTGVGEQRLFIFNSRDGYDATRLLLTDILTEWTKQVPGNLVIGIPNRDFLVAFSDADGDILRNIAHQVQVDSAQQSYGLTDQLFTIQNGQVQEYVWE
jgi:uncharacterized protein YtpQ (UPF0354 family)